MGGTENYPVGSQLGEREGEHSCMSAMIHYVSVYLKPMR